MPIPELVDFASQAVMDFADSLPETSTGAALLRSHRCGVAEAVLKAHEEWLAEQGLVVVPREPTVGMLGACMTKPLGAVTAETKDDMELLARDWQAMISAALAEE